eukprot:4189579-Prorocentrum_lima.AAC.1
MCLPEKEIGTNHEASQGLLRIKRRVDWNGKNVCLLAFFDEGTEKTELYNMPQQLKGTTLKHAISCSPLASTHS